METATRSESSATAIWGVGIVLTTVLIVVYLMNPPIVQFFNRKLTDVIQTAAAPQPISGRVVVVEIDLPSLSKYGQWPWSRLTLAELLEKITALGAASIGLDMVLAEPDRTFPIYDRRLPEEIRTKPSSGVPDQDLLPAASDAILAKTLSRGPFVLGFEFLFGNAEGPPRSCRLYPLKVIRVENTVSQGTSDQFYSAENVDGNLPLFSDAVSGSGFLNGIPDSDGILRRMPLLIRYDNQVFPALSLAMLLRAEHTDTIHLLRERFSHTYVRLKHRLFPIDAHGNLLVNFVLNAGAITHISALDIFSGKVPPEAIRNKIVLVGPLAPGLNQMYQTPHHPLSSHMDVHAQMLETLLSGRDVFRPRDFRVWESLLGLILAAGFSLCIARLNFIWNAGIGLIGIGCVWQATVEAFQFRGYLFSPLLPCLLLVSECTILTILKYRLSQRDAKEKADNALTLLKASENKLNVIIQSIPDIVFLLDNDGNITFISPAVLKYATRPEEVLGKPIIELVGNFSISSGEMTR